MASKVTVKSKAPSAKSKTEAKTTAIAPVAKKSSGGKLSVDVFDLKGKVVESMSLPSEIFGAKVNKKLVTQAVRVYLANQRAGSASTKTRGEVQGSTRKIYRQKGTGRARHGGVRAPIFVKGGIAHGPRPHDFSLSMPQKMRNAALCAALSAKLQEGEVKVIAGLEKITPKTKAMAETLSHMTDEKTNSLLLVTHTDIQAISRAARNLSGVRFTAANRLNTYEVVTAKTLVLMKEAVDTLTKRATSA